MMFRLRIVLIFLCSVFCLSIFAVKPPTMGWSTWNAFQLDINENKIKAQADELVKLGLDKVGYRYVNVDDGYWNGRGEDGHLKINSILFPSGMRALTDYLHKKGLKAGTYSDGGSNCCTYSCIHDNPPIWGFGVGLYQHEKEDCRTYFKEWNFDFIKVDYCGGQDLGLDEQMQYTKIREAITQSGKKNVTMNLCRWAYPGTWVSKVADSWRTTQDISCRWPSVCRIMKQNRYLQAFTGDGHYNDPDMLEVGNICNNSYFPENGTRLTHDEEVTHMAYWCISSAPLLIGCDLKNIPAQSLELLKNRDLIKMNQNRLGLGAPVVQRKGDIYVYAKDMGRLHGPERAVVVANLTNELQCMSVDIEALGFQGQVKLYDCLMHRDVGEAKESFEVSLPVHGSAAYFIFGKRKEKTVYQAEEAFLKGYQDISGQRTAVFAETASADQGAFVTQLGHQMDNYIEWPDVFSQCGGMYDLSIRYACAKERNMTLTVNSAQTHELGDLVTGSDSTSWKNVQVRIWLKKGSNKIRLDNPGRMPSIDCFTMQAVNDKRNSIK